MFDNNAYELIKKKILPTVKIVAVTKQKSVQDIISALNAGITVIGESYVQEAIKKYPSITDSLQKHKAEFHFIGRIQSNKIGKICQYFDCIQSISDVTHAQKIQTVCEQLGKKMNYFIQVNGDEEQKSGITMSQVFMVYEKIHLYKNMQFCGLMCIPPKGKEILWFINMRELQKKFTSKNISCELSMGMSNDYALAIKYGATMIRVGSLLFGIRDK